MRVRKRRPRKDRKALPIGARDPHIRALYEHMDAKKITLATVSLTSGIDIQTLSNWRRGESSPRLDLFMAVCEAVGLLWTVKHKKRDISTNQLELPL